jgi:DNA-binding MarR family transcriptional regulator
VSTPDGPGADSVAAELPTWMTQLPGVRPEVEAARQRIRRLARLFDEVLSDAASDHALTVGDWEALSVLQRHGPPHEGLPTDMARTLGITSGSMSLRIDRLTRAGLVEPGPRDDGDGRSRPVRLTASGQARWRLATEERTRVEHDLVAGALDPDQLEVLNGLLMPLLERFEEELGHAPATGMVRRKGQGPGAAPERSR